MRRVSSYTLIQDALVGLSRCPTVNLRWSRFPDGILGPIVGRPAPTRLRPGPKT